MPESNTSYKIQPHRFLTCNIDIRLKRSTMALSRPSSTSNRNMYRTAVSHLHLHPLILVLCLLLSSSYAADVSPVKASNSLQLSKSVNRNYNNNKRNARNIDNDNHNNKHHHHNLYENNNYVNHNDINNYMDTSEKIGQINNYKLSKDNFHIHSNINTETMNQNQKSHHNKNDNIIQQRTLEDNNNNDKYYNNNNNNNYYNNNNNYYNQNNYYDDNYYAKTNDDGNPFIADELCSKYLVSFLEGTTDAKDNCEGIQNAYVGAYCDDARKNGQVRTGVDDDHDDYFTNFNHFSCCEALKSHYDEYCNDGDVISNLHLLIISTVLLLCEMAKSLIKTKKMHFLPEAGGCIIVGILCASLIQFSSSTFSFSLDDISFDEELFICVLLPPIIFEAALSVNKHEFKRRRLAIAMFAIVGTILSSLMTGFMVHYSSAFLQSATTIPMIDSIIFGSLISSIDPVAILSVLTSLKFTEQDTIFIIVFGESLLNDGVAITMFKSLVVRFNEKSISSDDILGAIADFLIVGFGSIAVGFACGFLCLIYFWILRKKLNPAMEVASFFLWAGIPYYICDGVGLSGIVGIVTMGFIMDLYIAAPKRKKGAVNISTSNSPVSPPINGADLHRGGCVGGDSTSKIPKNNDANTDLSNIYFDFGDSQPCTQDSMDSVNVLSPSARSIYSVRSFRTLRTLNMRELLLQEERFRLSHEADKHVRFVAHLLAQLSENAIFVYLGLFLFSNKYEWQSSLIVISIVSCVLSRAIMVFIICALVWYITILRINCGWYKVSKSTLPPDYQTYEEGVAVVNASDSNDAVQETPHFSRTAQALQDRKIQLVLVLAGLRGAVSLALVESIPIYNGVTGEGTEFKPELKAMTSAAIIFTIFIFGGGAYYILKKFNIEADGNRNEGGQQSSHPIIPPPSSPYSPISSYSTQFQSQGQHKSYPDYPSLHNNNNYNDGIIGGHVELSNNIRRIIPENAICSTPKSSNSNLKVLLGEDDDNHKKTKATTNKQFSSITDDGAILQPEIL